MSTIVRTNPIGRLAYIGLAVAGVAVVISGLWLVGNMLARPEQQRTFSTADEAVRTLVEIVNKGDVNALLAVFGPEGKELLSSSDAATARMNRQVFAVAAAEQWHLTDDGPASKTLVIGNENWPFPVPLVKDGNAWRFDTAAGKEEVIARRIGRNELATLNTVRAYVTAQQRYAAEGHDGNPAGAYAAKFRSDPGKQNGLYWAASRGQKRSPFGDLVAQAAEEGHTLNPDTSKLSAYQGYYFRILTGQGAAATDGAREYVVNGQMSGGFALVAWPAQYDVTGVMTFLVNQDGVIREQDLGPDTDAIAQKMSTYDPDSSWSTVK